MQCLRQSAAPKFRSRLPRRSSSYAFTTSNQCLEHVRLPLSPEERTRQLEERNSEVTRMWIYGLSAVATGIVTIYVAFNFAPPPVQKTDARRNDPLSKLPGSTPVETTHDDEVPTGTSTVPTFPRTIEIAGETDVKGEALEYQLVGLGIRTVSFLSIQVYVIGLYVATEDIAALQQAMVRQIDGVATTLIKGEKEKLKGMLLDPVEGERIWDKVLRKEGLRSVVRIVPTRNTDFNHLRDGWVRGISGRVQRAQAAGEKEYDDKQFGVTMQDFKNIFSGGRKSVPKGKTLLLVRGTKGGLEVLFDDGEGKGLEKIGELQDERISRQIWLGYLAGKTVSSEGARKSIVEGIMDFVERPIGTVATQVI